MDRCTSRSIRGRNYDLASMQQLTKGDTCSIDFGAMMQQLQAGGAEGMLRCVCLVDSASDAAEDLMSLLRKYGYWYLHGYLYEITIGRLHENV